MSDKLREIFFGQYDPLARAAPQGEEFDRVFDELEELEQSFFDRRAPGSRIRLRSALPGEQWEQVWRHTLLTAQLRDMAYADYFAEGFRLAQELYRHPGA